MEVAPGPHFEEKPLPEKHSHKIAVTSAPNDFWSKLSKFDPMLVASVGIGVQLRCMLKPYLVGNYSHSDKRRNKRPRCGGQGLLPGIEKSLPTRQVANTEEDLR